MENVLCDVCGKKLKLEEETEGVCQKCRKVIKGGIPEQMMSEEIKVQADLGEILEGQGLKSKLVYKWNRKMTPKVKVGETVKVKVNSSKTSFKIVEG